MQLNIKTDRRISDSDSADHGPFVLLLKFRSIMSDPKYQIIIPLLYQIYLTVCLLGGFYFGKDILWPAVAFLALDVLTIAAGFVRQSMVLGQVMCAVNLLMSAGICGQSMFARRFAIGGSTVAGTVKSLGVNSAIGLALAAIAVVVCILLSKLVYNADVKTRTVRIKAVCYGLLVALVIACVGFLVLLSGGDQWMSLFGKSFQPGEWLKFAFLFYLAVVSGASDKEIGFVRKLVLEIVAFVAVCAYYALLSEFGSILIVMLVFAAFLLISHRNWIAIVAIFLVIAVIAAGAFGIIRHFGNIYIEEKFSVSETQDDEAAQDTPAAEDAATEDSELTDGEETQEKQNMFVGREFGKITGKIVSIFTENYKKIYMRAMVVKDIDGNDPDTLPGVREALRNEYSYQARAALDAIGISRLIPTNAPIFNYVPVGSSDYVYTSIIQSGGLISIIFMLFAYLLLADSAFALISSNCCAFNRNLVFVSVTSILFQMFINILGVNNIIPLTGVTLPFVSSGGSSLSACLMMIGCLVWADIDYYMQKTKQKIDWENNENVTGGVLVNESANISVN